MPSDKRQIKIGLSKNSTCNYISSRSERVAVALDDAMHTTSGYELLLANGFRRSGQTIYAPHCEMCNACQSIRVSILDFKPSKSQKRILAKAKEQALHWQVKTEMDSEWFELYSRYITARHADGTMFPPQEEVFSEFSRCEWLKIDYLHIYQQDKLVAIAITDNLTHSGSAFYTFFDPEFPLSLGTLAILYQLEHCVEQQKQWLYLGYQIDECSAMNYKVRFQRHQRLVNHRWQG
ncbi:putative arginyl-tRNA--protein transferase [Vibrio sp. MACH09]|uniref:arginyltransferase n=1 Tax=unclassified Vibrio TaxID=2614977 RepID=UPI0014933119|nr:arginyltransferase [Vibrio sp. MACH09]NOI68062.1 arginyltransferase [Vibrio sp. 99-8-1]GLO61223.1 putative arginyl-tRNA--protein transferase [Vibrio sp. MACH09]